MSVPVRQPRWLEFRIRFLDRAAALVVGLVLVPFVVVVAVLIRLEDGGPAFIRVPRVGRNRAVFDMWKLRSMRADGPDGRATGSSLTARDDDRITRIGARIRALHFDEVPQLLNVLKGEMIVVGARPESPDYVHDDDERWDRVLRTPPGIVGPTQLVISEWERNIIADSPDDGAYERDVLPTKLRIDRWYLETCSIVRDFEIAWALLKRFAPNSKGTRMRKRVYRELGDEVIELREWEEAHRRAAARHRRERKGRS